MVYGTQRPLKVSTRTTAQAGWEGLCVCSRGRGSTERKHLPPREAGAPAAQPPRALSAGGTSRRLLPTPREPQLAFLGLQNRIFFQVNNLSHCIPVSSLGEDFWKLPRGLNIQDLVRCIIIGTHGRTCLIHLARGVVWGSLKYQLHSSFQQKHKGLAQAAYMGPSKSPWKNGIERWCKKMLIHAWTFNTHFS